MNRVRKSIFLSKNIWFKFCSNLSWASKMDLMDLKSDELPLTKILKHEIQQKGPMSFHSYMSRSLTDDPHGFYMKKDVFNKKGDFITSPEISQMFGEMIGIWAINLFNQISPQNFNDKQKQKRLKIIEFGPGKGTLMRDVLRVFYQLDQLQGIEVNFVEASGFMQNLQQQTISNSFNSQKIYLNFRTDTHIPQFDSEDQNKNISFKWYKMYEQFQKSNMNDFKEQIPVIIIAHEFFDALPIYIFQYQKNLGWCEKLVNINHQNQEDTPFEYYISEPNTESVKKILKPEKTFSKEIQTKLKHNDKIEICPQSMVIGNSIAELISQTNGGALFIDYGENHSFNDSIRGIRSHKFVKDFLQYPGEIDLSAYVNFKALKDSAERVGGIIATNPIPQGLFLESMGMNTRLSMLCKNKSKSEIEKLESQYLRLVHPDEMGQIYKMQYIGRKVNGNLLSLGHVFPFNQEDQQPNVYY